MSELIAKHYNERFKVYKRMMNQILENIEFANNCLPIIKVDTNTFKDLNTLKVNVVGSIDLSKLHG